MKAAAADSKEELEESAWVARLRKGDPAAEAWLLEQHRDRLYRAAVHFLGWQDPEAEDVVQETFLQALRGLDGFEGRSKLYTWLNQICARLCFRRIRSRQRTLLGTEADVAEALQLPARGGDALHSLLDAERRSQLAAALQKLDARCRELVERRDLKGEAYAACARALKLPLGTFMSRLSRCRARLKTLIVELHPS